MYAIALADGPVVFAARDPLGIKPLYYVEKEGSFRFASEIKALRRWAPDVREFPPGVWFRTDTGFHPFHRLEPPAPERESTETWQRLLRHRLEEAVEKRLMSDVPVGTFLSGGLDSSIITALARQHVDKLHTVPVGTEESPDLQAARQVSRYLGTIHHEYVFGRQDVIDSLAKIVYHLESFDVDLVRSAIPCYFASRIASEYVKVILTGEGADELFAGYEYHRSFDRPEELQAELLQSVSALHNMNLQRVDRMTMAHSIEGRVPFLDLQVIDVAQRIPPELKLHGSPPVEKWILRAACEDLLPHDTMWRTKAQFDVGSGTVALLGRVIPDLARRFGLCAGCTQQSRRLESMLYRLLYRQRLPEATERLVARWRGSAS